MPNNGSLPDILTSSLRLQHSGLTPNQKSMILSSAGGDLSLETTNRHMRRIPQPCGMELKQDVPAAKDDLLGTQESLSRPLANKPLGDETFTGDAQVSPKKTEKNERRWSGPPSAPSGNGNMPN